jgi:hypothetical protein
MMVMFVMIVVVVVVVVVVVPFMSSLRRQGSRFKPGMTSNK